MPIAGDSDNARLVRIDTGEDVVFDYNPAAIVISHTAPMQPSAGKGARAGKTDSGSGSTAVVSNWDEMAKANGVTSIAIRAVTFAGAQLVQNCTLLLTWTQFKDVGKSEQKQDLPELKFIWGPQTYGVNLNQVSINYTRFSSVGAPVRAQVDLTLHVIPKPLQPTNPSSGGLSGRRTHLLTGAENLPALATRTYGGPDRWREIATANGIRDPLRVRPGKLLYLPSEQEDGR